MAVFPGGFPVNEVITPLDCPDRMFVTWPYRYSAVFDRTSGTEQLHFSCSGENFCATIAVSPTDSTALTFIVLPAIMSQINSLT